MKSLPTIVLVLLITTLLSTCSTFKTGGTGGTGETGETVEYNKDAYNTYEFKNGDDDYQDAVTYIKENVTDPQVVIHITTTNDTHIRVYSYDDADYLVGEYVSDDDNREIKISINDIKEINIKAYYVEVKDNNTPKTYTPVLSESPVIADSNLEEEATLLGNKVLLDGSNIFNSDGSEVSYLWTIKSKPADSFAEIDNPDYINTSFIVDAEGEYVIEFVVNNNGKVNSPAIVTINAIGTEGEPDADAGTETNVQLFVDVGLTHFIFDDGTVSGTSNHLGFSLAAGFKSLLEIGYTNTVQLGEASMNEDAGVISEDGFFTRTQLFYLRGNIPISTNFSAYALAGYSKVNIEATTTYVTCLFFCDDSIISTSTTSEYLSDESGLALGLGMQWITQNKRRLQLQYIDYIYDSESDFSGIYFSYGWMFDMPPFN